MFRSPSTAAKIRPVNFDLSENQQLFKATVERFYASTDIAARRAVRKLPGGLDRARWQQLADLGMIGLPADEADGGLGGSLIDCAVVAQALGYGLAVEPWLECGFLPARLLAGTDDVAAVVSGRVLATLAFAEANGRYALDAHLVTATAQGGAYLLSGEKRLVLSGGTADLFIVSANLGGETRLFTVKREAVGLDLKPYPVVDGSLAAVATFRNVSAEPPFAGIDRLIAAIGETRLMAAAEIVGTARRLFDDTLAYVKSREQFGKPIGSFQVIQHRMVDMLTKCEAMQSSLYYGLLLPNTNAEGIKAFIGTQAQWVAEQAVQLHGGMGVTDELPIGHGLKRIMLLSKLFGDPASGFARYEEAA